MAGHELSTSEYRQYARKYVDSSRAQQIKHWRVNQRMSFSQIATLVKSRYGDNDISVNSGSHSDGKILCEAAREKLREPRSVWENY